MSWPDEPGTSAVVNTKPLPRNRYEEFKNTSLDYVSQAQQVGFGEAQTFFMQVAQVYATLALAEATQAGSGASGSPNAS